ncbi:MAG: hypothetical protein NC211_02735 [Alistipes senegalensis]|nr:hypothetical protein [Oxalobacter formigenes]MCM1280740.1 hypothetical protein [Alistipes senegalensis]
MSDTLKIKREIVQEIAAEEYALQTAFAAERDEKRRIALVNGWDAPVTKKVAAAIPVCAALSTFEMLVAGYATDDDDLIVIAGRFLVESGLFEAASRREKAACCKTGKKARLASRHCQPKPQKEDR